MVGLCAREAAANSFARRFVYLVTDSSGMKPWAPMIIKNNLRKDFVFVFSPSKFGHDVFHH